MRKLALLIAFILLGTFSACGGGSGGGSSKKPTKRVTPSASDITLSGQLDMGAALVEGGATPTVMVNGNSATVTAAGANLYDWSVTISTSAIHDDYRVEYFVNGNLIGAVDYMLDP